MLKNILKQKIADGNFQKEFEFEILQSVQAKKSLNGGFLNQDSMAHLQE